MLSRNDLQFISDFKGGIARQHGRGCIDENAWYPPLKRRKEFWGAEKSDFKKECWMFANWKLTKNPCKDWAKAADLCDCPNMDVQPHKNATGEHPVTWHNVSAIAFGDLVKSPFWFARKFSNKAIPLES